MSENIEVKNKERVLIVVARMTFILLGSILIYRLFRPLIMSALGFGEVYFMNPNLYVNILYIVALIFQVKVVFLSKEGKVRGRIFFFVILIIDLVIKITDIVIFQDALTAEKGSFAYIFVTLWQLIPKIIGYTVFVFHFIIISLITKGRKKAQLE